MRIVRLEVENLEEVNFAERPRGHRASGGNQSTQRPVPQLPLHANLHLTTTAFILAVSLAMHSTVRPLLVFMFFAVAGLAQTTQGLISGRLVDSVTGKSIAGASVGYWSSTGNFAGTAASDASGYYYLPLLSPGFYRIRVTAPSYQSQEVQEIELTVAARVELDFRLRP